MSNTHEHKFVLNLIAGLNQLNYPASIWAFNSNRDYTLSVMSPRNIHFTLNYTDLSSHNDINATASAIQLSAQSPDGGDLDCTSLDNNPMWTKFCCDITSNADYANTIANHLAFIIYAMENIENQYSH